MYSMPGIVPPLPYDKDKLPLGENGEVPLIPGDVPIEDLNEEVGEL